MSPKRAECPALSREYPSRESRPRARGHVPAAPEHVPAAQGLAGQITEAFPWDTAPLYLIRDNDGAYGARFRRRVRAMGIRDRPIRPYSPWMNGRMGRLIGSIRREVPRSRNHPRRGSPAPGAKGLCRIPQRKPHPPGAGQGRAGRAAH